VNDKNVAQKLIESHLVSGRLSPGEEIGLRIDQTLTQDATGTMVMLELEAMGLDRVRTELSAQYVDHNLLQTDSKNPDDHLFLFSACQRFGIWYSRPGNGVSHPVHMENFGAPGKTLLGSDSHTPAAGSLGMLAIGAGGLEVALAMAGEPFHVTMPEIWGVRLVGRLPDWVSAKDVVLEMLRRHDVDGGVGRIIEYFGSGLEDLSAMDRHVIANMGTELGATTTVFPADNEVRRFLESMDRADDFVELRSDPGASYDLEEEIDLGQLEPVIARPSSPGDVVPVRQESGKEIYQAMIGSSANPGFRDFAIAAEMVDGREIHPRVSFDVNPTSRQILLNLTASSHLSKLIRAGGRVHQAGCNGCIGMGQAPATGRISLRTVPRNFPGRSGTKEDAVYLVSPETATASALTGRITDPRSLGFEYPRVIEPERPILNRDLLIEPSANGGDVELVKGPNIRPLPDFETLADEILGPVLIVVGDHISTDEIMPAGSGILPLRSNVPAISHYVFHQIDENYYERAMRYQRSGSFIVAGENYGQGSSREHAALAPRYLGVRAVIAKSFARIHRQNLINFGILPLTFKRDDEGAEIEQGDELELPEAKKRIQDRSELDLINRTRDSRCRVEHGLTTREIEILTAGSILNHWRQTDRSRRQQDGANG